MTASARHEPAHGREVFVPGLKAGQLGDAPDP